MTNGARRKKTLQEILNHPHFKLGMQDKMTDEPFNSEYDGWDAIEQAMYEWGRTYYISMRKHKLTISVIGLRVAVDAGDIK